MSMYRQIWQTLMLTVMLSFVAGLLVSTLSTRSFLENQLGGKDANSAAFLALSLSQRKMDVAELKQDVITFFDNEHDELIRVSDPEGREIISQKSPAIGSVAGSDAGSDAPLWFVNLFPLNSTPGQAQINDGLSKIGTITLVGNTQIAYRTFWESTEAMAGVLLLTSLFCGFVGTLVLKRIKKPLNAVISQAQAIADRHFITTPESTVFELRQLTSAMNSTVMLVKQMFSEETKRLEIVRVDANSDSLTKLANRTYFMAQLRTVLETEDAYSGSILLIKIANLGEINKRLGHTETDDLLKSVTATLNKAIELIPNALAARLNGTDFGLLLPLTDAHPLADKLLESLAISTSAYIHSGPVAYIGASKFSYGMNIAHLMSQIDAVVAGAESRHVSCVVDASGLENKEIPRSNEEWLKLIYDAIENNETKLAHFPVTDFGQRLVHNESPLRLKLAEEWLPAGRFLPVAERLGMSSTLDTTAVTLGIEELTMDRDLVGLAINLSARSLEDVTFCEYIRVMLLENSKAASRLWIEFPEYGAYAHFAAFSEFRKKMQGTGCRFGLEHFGRQFSQIGLLQDLKLDYLKVDASFIHDIANNHGNQVFLKGLIAIGHHIGMQIYAEGVTEQSEFITLARLGFDGVTGPGVRLSPTVERNSK